MPKFIVEVGRVVTDYETARIFVEAESAEAAEARALEIASGDGHGVTFETKCQPLDSDLWEVRLTPMKVED